MKRLGIVLAAMVGLGMLAAACGSSSNKPAATAASGGASSAPTSAPAATSAQAASSAPLNVKVTSNAKFGNILTDANGMTLYLRTSDPQNGSSCTGGCASTWPPLTITGKPSVDSSISASLISTITRDDGSTQVTINGKPLYHYAPDKAPGDTGGEGIANVWYVVAPNGEAVTTAKSSSTGTTGGSYGGY